MAQQKDKNTAKWMYYGSYVNAAGKRVQYKKRGFDSKKEARKAEDLFREQIECEKADISFSKLYDEFLIYQTKQVKKSSVETDKYIYNRLIYDINGSTEYKDKKFLQNLIDEYDKKFSKEYVSKIFYCLRKVFNFGIKEGYFNYNPMDKITRDSRKNEVKEEMSFWEPVHFNKFIEAVDDPLYKCVSMTLYYMGIRRGEMLALNWNDINFENKTITVDKTYSTKTNTVTTPKTKNSYRTITMPDILIKELKAWKQNVSHFMSYDPNGYVFGNASPLPVETLRRKFKEYIKETNNKYRKEEQIPVIRIHDLRHSHASFLINNMSAGFTDFDIAKRLGDTVATLHNTYAHWFKAADKGIIDFMNQAK